MDRVDTMTTRGSASTFATAVLVAAAGLASPLVAFAALAGLTVVALIVAFPYWGFLLTAAVVPMERIGKPIVALILVWAGDPAAGE